MFLRHRLLTATDGEGAGDADAGGAPPADNATPPADTPPADTATPPADDLAALRAELAAAKAKLAAADEQKTDAEKLREQLDAMRGDLDATKAGALAHARASTMEALGVLPQYREFAPEADPRTAEGKAALEKWAAERPAMLSRRTQEAPSVDVADTAILGTEGKGNFFVSPRSLADMAKNLGIG